MNARAFTLVALTLALAACTAADNGSAPTTTAPPSSTDANPGAVPTSPAPATPAPSVTPGDVAPPPGDADVAAIDGRVATLVEGIRLAGDTHRVTVDLIRFLTGAEAAEAAQAHGDEYPPPNDFYIVNDDPTLHALDVAAGIDVAMLMDGDGELCGDIAIGCPPMPLEDWAAALGGASGGLLRSVPYWMTVSGGVVTGIEQQYMP